MRRAFKKQAQEFVGLFEQAHKEIQKQLRKGLFHEAISLLGECQQGAIRLGNLIEHSEGEDFVTIGFLEDYCETVYQIYERISQKGTVDTDRINMSLKTQLAKIRESIQNDIKVRLEVVFLPYKASMWDSLESVWKAADEDPDCDAYVVPIPYYDKNPDGSFRERHYEGDQYPEYVPITDYEKYDIAKRKPDVIFIHNPYDEYNCVTSIHPFFYSKNLKQFTEQLVYIPYFVLGKINPKDQRALDNIKHFCIVPGVMNADRVIVQSENMQRAYINILSKATGEKKRRYWETKILGLGSPKVDKVLSTKKEDLETPEKWKEIIRKPNGDYKKIFFYNTSVNGLLTYGPEMLKKMEDVFDLFREHQNEITLLWRPHPLMKATVEAMRPQLWAMYESIVERYKKEEWGIFDDTADMDRAVTLSDVYYGDFSSVVNLYQALGKLAIIQEASILLNKDYILDVTDIVEYKNRLFILTNLRNLFEYNLVLKKVKFCGTICADYDQGFIGMTMCEDKLYIMPWGANHFSIYNIDKREFQKLPLSLRNGRIESQNFSICFTHGKTVYFWGGFEGRTLYIDSRNNSVHENIVWLQRFKEKYGHETEIQRSNVCIVGDSFWIPLTEDNIVMQYDMQKEEYVFWHIGKRKIEYWTICYDGKDFWLSGDEAFIVRWNKETDEILELDEFPKGFEIGNGKDGKRGLFYNSCCWRGNIYFSPLNSNMLIGLNKKTLEMKSLIRMEISSFWGCRMWRMSDCGIYVEKQRWDDGGRVDSFLINPNGKCEAYAIKLNKDSNELKTCAKENIETESGFTIETSPQCIPTLFQMLQESNGVYQEAYRDYRKENIFGENGERIWMKVKSYIKKEKSIEDRGL